LCVSHTTRKPRINEVNKIDYNFISTETFETMKKNNDFLEYENIFGNMYGTSKSEIIKLLDKKLDVILDIEWNGANKVKKIFPNNTIKILLFPPSKEELKRRLEKRNTKNIQVRLNSLFEGLDHVEDYNYVIINIDIHESYSKIKSLITAEKIKRDFRTQEIIKSMSQR
ncbi:MAG: guanylate kinase, partial [Gammaproteobacteria bacterium]|nr:guanylate kinase [Gammaproteobacteria bacterium]